MTEHILLRRIKAVRRDLGSLLFHFTRSRQGPDHPFSKESLPDASAYEVLQEILRQRCLRGSSHYIRGGHKCVCFTEAPISELAAIFQLAKIVADPTERPRYEPFGIAVTKEWLFRQGGRPVIYQSEAEYQLLPEELQHRHVLYDPKLSKDFTWEREWRVKAESLKLDPKETLAIVPESRFAFDLMFNYADWIPEYERGEPLPFTAYPEPQWLAVSLDFFGIPKVWADD